MSTTDLVVGAGLLGLLSHVLLFIHGEWHMWAPRLFWGAICTSVAISTLLLSHGRLMACMTVWEIVLPLLTYLLGLFGSIEVYRVFFHRLRHFPGPFWARVSKFWHVYQCTDSKNHLLLDRLFKQYGPLVRTGTIRAIDLNISEMFRSNVRRPMRGDYCPS